MNRSTSASSGRISICVQVNRVIKRTRLESARRPRYCRPKFVGNDQRSSEEERTSAFGRPGTSEAGRLGASVASKTARPHANQSQARWKYEASSAYDTGQVAGEIH